MLFRSGAHPDSHPRYGGPGMGAPGAGAQNSPKRPGKPKKKHTTAIKVAACVGFAVLFEMCIRDSLYNWNIIYGILVTICCA